MPLKPTTKNKHFITQFDGNYLPKGIATIESLLAHEPHADIAVVCDDNRTHDVLGDWFGSRIRTVRLSDIESAFDDLVDVKRSRSWIEYLWTLTPIIMSYALDEFDWDSVAYIDADLYFFDNLDELYAEIDADCAVIPHRWTPEHADRLRPNGIYNVAWVYARDRDFLDEWSSLSKDWCGVVNNGKGVGEQGYLDGLQPKYECHIVQHLGANLAPWNQEQYDYDWDGDHLFVNGYKLLFYHFHEFRHTDDGRVLKRTGYKLHPVVVDKVYRVYEAEIARICRRLEDVDG